MSESLPPLRDATVQSDNGTAIQVKETPPAQFEGDRFHGLDWLRGIASLLVVALHAGIAYTLTPFPGLAWPTHDPHPSPFVDAVTWWIDGFIMPLFLLLGGFVAAQLFLKRGPDAFLRNRARRLLLPLLFGCVVILPLDLYIWLLGWAADGRIPLKKLRSLKLGETGHGLWGVGHLWFLEYLFLFCAAAWGLHRIAMWWSARRTTADRDHLVTRSVSEGLSRVVSGFPRLHSFIFRFARFDRRISPPEANVRRLGVDAAQPLADASGYDVNRLTPKAQHQDLRIGFQSKALHSDNAEPARFSLAGSFWIPLLLAIPSALALWWEPRIVIGFRHSWHPLAANLLYYAPCFAGGWWLYHQVRAGRSLSQLAPWSLGLATVCFVAFLPLLREHVIQEFTGPKRTALAALFTGFAWLSAIGWLAMFLGRFRPVPRAVRYLSNASFWVYLFHHPVVGLAQVALAGSALPAATKFMLVTVIGVGLSLLTYEVAVRFTWVGQLLNGRRESLPCNLRDDADTVPVSPERPLRRAA